jgi:ATP-binding cassette, subfamily B, bacterial
MGESPTPKRQGAHGRNSLSSLDIDSLTWSVDTLGTALARAATLLNPEAAGSAPVSPNAVPSDRESAALHVGHWLEMACEALALGAQPVNPRAKTLDELAPGPGRASLLTLAGAAVSPPRYLCLLPARPAGMNVLAPDGRIVALSDGDQDALDARIFGESECPPAVLTAVARLPLGARRFTRLRRSLRRRGRRFARVPEGWIFTSSPTSLADRARSAGLFTQAWLGAAAYLAQVCCFAGAMWLAGRGALNGHLERSWLVAFGFMLAMMVMFRGLAGSRLGTIWVAMTGLARERLLESITRLDPDEVRHRGVGQWMGLVLEVDALENAARGGGLLGLTAICDLAVGMFVLLIGAGGLVHVVLLAAWTTFLALRLIRYRRRLAAWTDARLHLTHEQVERMVGHRTVVMQGDPVRAAADDARALARYDRLGAMADEELALLQTVLPRGFLLSGLLAFSPGLLAGTIGTGDLAASLGGLMLVASALQKLGNAAPALAVAAMAWIRLSSVLAKGVPARHPDDGVPGAQRSQGEPAGALLAGREVFLQYPGRSEPVLRGCSFNISRGDHILVEGDSGSGKSTLGALMAGLLAPSSGLMLFAGLDHHSLSGRRWRRMASGVPQFHVNHVFSSSLLFNLLFGRRWPPRIEDVQEAERVCRELGLDDVIGRMPAGLQQIVGDSGWQLSHGEKNRLFLARSLLQPVDIRVLDETLGALDPETAERVLACLVRRSETLVLIAHT